MQNLLLFFIFSLLLKRADACLYHNLSNLVTDNYPTLDTTNSDVKNDILHVIMFMPLVNSRLNTSIFFGDINSPNAHPECAFPGPFWIKTLDNTGDCQEVYTLDIAWTNASRCGWSIDNVTQPGFVIWKNNIFVHHIDELSVFRGIPVLRDTIHTFPVQIRFQTTIELDTNINIVAPVNLLAAVTLQTYNPAARQGEISILTSLQWPFYLVNVSGNFPASINAALSAAILDCSNVSGSACTQLFTFIIDPQQACSLSGSYELMFVLACRGNPADCPLDANTTAAVTASVNSENFCNGVELDIGLTGYLEVFQESPYPPPPPPPAPPASPSPSASSPSSLSPPPSPPQCTESFVFTSGLQSSWQDLSTSATRSITTIDGNAALEVTFTDANGMFYLHSTTEITSAQDAFVSFRINGASAGSQQLEFRVYQSGVATSAAYSIPTLISNQWTSVIVPISNFTGVSIIDGFSIGSSITTTVQPTFWIDDIVVTLCTPFTRRAVKDSFLYSQTAFFRATLSTGNTVSVVSSTIEQVRISDGVNTRFLYDMVGSTPSVTTDGALVSFAIAVGKPAAQPGFSFVPNEQVTPAPVDSQQQYVITARISVTYVTAAGVRRRSIVVRQAATSSSTAGDFGVGIVMENPTPAVSSSPAIEVMTSDTSSITTETLDFVPATASSFVATVLLLAL